MVTYREVKASPSGWPEEETPPLKDFELALSELLSYYRHRADKAKIVEALDWQAKNVSEDGGWTKPEKIRNDDSADEIEPEVNPVSGEYVDPEATLE
jgi:hypothetical protein